MGLAETYEGWFRDVAKANEVESEAGSTVNVLPAEIQVQPQSQASVGQSTPNSQTTGGPLSFENPEQDLLDVTTLDIDIFFRRCVGHRLRVRDHWQDEVLVCLRNVGLKEGQPERPEEEHRPTIRDVLSHILEAV